MHILWGFLPVESHQHGLMIEKGYMKKQSKLVSEKQIENEASRTRSVSQCKLIRDGGQISKQDLY